MDRIVCLYPLRGFIGMDILGWGVTAGVWTNLSKALKLLLAAWWEGSDRSS